MGNGENPTSREELMTLMKLLETRSRLQPERLNARLGLSCVDFDPEKLTATYLFRPAELFLNPYGEVHGGAAASVFDTACGMGAVALTRTFPTTVNLNVTYHRPMKGEEFSVEVHYEHVGNRLVNAEARIISPENGKVCSTCAATYYRTGITPKEFEADPHCRETAANCTKGRDSDRR